MVNQTQASLSGCGAPTCTSHKTFLFLTCSCCLYSHFSGWSLLYYTENVPSSPLSYISLAAYLKNLGQVQAQPVAVLLGTGSRDVQQGSWPGMEPLGTLLLWRLCKCSRRGAVVKAAEGCADSPHPCWSRDSQSVTHELTFTFGTGGWGLFSLVGREPLHFGNGLNDCSGLWTAVTVVTNPWQKPHSWKTGIKGQE